MNVAKTEQKVMELVEAELQKNPGASVDELFAKAKKVSSSIGKLSLRQFNARYPLQVKRRASQKKGGRKRKKTTRRRSQARASAGNGRDAVRAAFLSFASDLAAAQERKDLVKVLADVDKYVDRAMKAAGG